MQTIFVKKLHFIEKNQIIKGAISESQWHATAALIRSTFTMELWKNALLLIWQRVAASLWNFNVVEITFGNINQDLPIWTTSLKFNAPWKRVKYFMSHKNLNRYYILASCDGTTTKCSPILPPCVLPEAPPQDPGVVRLGYDWWNNNLRKFTNRL